MVQRTSAVSSGTTELGRTNTWDKIKSVGKDMAKEAYKLFYKDSDIEALLNGSDEENAPIAIADKSVISQ